MRLKTFWKRFSFVLVLVFSLSTLANLWSKVRGRGKEDAGLSARVTISVYNEADAPTDVLGQAERQAEQVFWRAGIEVTWLNCRIPAVSEEASRACREAVFPEHLHLRVVRRSLGLKAEAMGISFQAQDGSGCYADVFYEPMEQLHRSDGTDIVNLFGLVAAHEIGHLLLGANSHSPAGIMHARWTAGELASAKVGGLVFSEQESQRMRAMLTTALQASKEKQSNPAEALPRTGD